MHTLLCPGMLLSLARLLPTPPLSMLAPGTDTVAESISTEVVKTTFQLECNVTKNDTFTSRQSRIQLNLLNNLPHQMPCNILDEIALKRVGLLHITLNAAAVVFAPISCRYYGHTLDRKLVHSLTY